MITEFFVNRDHRYPNDETTDEYAAANGTYSLEVVPLEGDKVSFDGGYTERLVQSRVFKIDPVYGHQRALVQLR
jgi:hypothetical protein